ncbi:hypothetical protein Tco_0806452 [Tanacetum coccineum]
MIFEIINELGDDDDVKKMEELGVDFDDIGSSGGEVESLDVSEDVLDPVKEFKFLVIGHEFDHYPKKMIRDIRNWDWFLEEHKEYSDEDEDEVGNKKAKKGKRRKRKKGGANDDEDDDVWTGESEEDAELIKKLKNDPKPKYTTRSKDQKKSKKGASTSKSGKHTTKSSAMDVDVEDDEEDAADETLGGFIVDDEDVGEGIDEDVDEETDEDDEEEEFEEDEDE